MIEVRGRRRGVTDVPTWLRRDGPVDPIAVLSVARQVAAHLSEGPAGAGGRAAARRLRWLLGVHAVGLAGLSGTVEWSGRPVDEAAALELAAAAPHSEKFTGKPGLAAVPLIVDHEVTGVLVVDGPSAGKAVREAAWLVENALERRHGEYTTVADEFEAIETYLVLQRAVMGERLQVQIRVVPDVLAVPLPYLVLQPLVENAIRHGLEPLGRGGTVQVQGEARNGDCVISVEDDGVGMAPAEVAALLAGKATGRVGLSNVDRRLRTAYGPWYGLVVETERDAGTRVLVRVPLSQPGVLPS
ncbi:sensor histidine kinase [Nocardia sp. NPDC020380]|uniref:sensor histidine kinase n=1 Tax=Nocardia sp. NPDC020380 TaxID=3364309 RepID=UPI0037AE42D6